MNKKKVISISRRLVDKRLLFLAIISFVSFSFILIFLLNPKAKKLSLLHSQV